MNTFSPKKLIVVAVSALALTGVAGTLPAHAATTSTSSSLVSTANQGGDSRELNRIIWVC